MPQVSLLRPGILLGKASRVRRASRNFKEVCFSTAGQAGTGRYGQGGTAKLGTCKAGTGKADTGKVCTGFSPYINPEKSWPLGPEVRFKSSPLYGCGSISNFRLTKLISED